MNNFLCFLPIKVVAKFWSYNHGTIFRKMMCFFETLVSPFESLEQITCFSARLKCIGHKHPDRMGQSLIARQRAN